MQTLYRWQSIDPKQNRYRFYNVGIGSDLWGNVLLIKHWGRIGTRGRRQFVWASVDDLNKLILHIREERLAREYELLLF